MAPAAQRTDGEEFAVDLVFEGGGVKGIGLAGAYRELTDRGYRPDCVAGTSAGAITAALVAVGYGGAEVEQIVLHGTQFQKFADPAFLDRLGAPGEVAQFLRRRGLHSGKYFLEWMRGHLAAKGVTNFGQLRDPAAGDATRRYRLQVIASDLTGRRMLVLPRDADRLGLDPDALGIAEAVRMSMSIPVFFEPVMQRHGVTGHEHVIVDGGLLSNYPIWLFDSPESATPRFPTFGMLLVAPDQVAPLLPRPASDASLPTLHSDVDYLKAIAETVMEAHDRFYVEQANYARTIPIPTLGVKATQFDIAPEQVRDLFESGRNAAARFLRSWDFQSYIDRFRSGGEPPSRRETLLRSDPPKRG